MLPILQATQLEWKGGWWAPQPTETKGGGIYFCSLQRSFFGHLVHVPLSQDVRIYSDAGNFSFSRIHNI